MRLTTLCLVAAGYLAAGLIIHRQLMRRLRSGGRSPRPWSRSGRTAHASTPWPRLSAREARKRLLIAEGDLLRAGLAQDLTAIRASARSFHARTAQLVTVIATLADLAGAFIGRKRRAPEPSAPEPWWRILLRGVALAAPLWRRWHARGDDATTR